MEAMACENAIIASDVGETRKIITGKEGILVSLTDKEIARAIKTLVTNPTEANKKGQAARLKTMTEHNIEKYMNYFSSITN